MSQVVGNFKISRAGRSEVLANHLRVNQSERAKSTIHLCGIYYYTLWRLPFVKASLADMYLSCLYLIITGNVLKKEVRSYSLLLHSIWFVDSNELKRHARARTRARCRNVGYPSSRVTHHSSLHFIVTRALATRAIAVVAGKVNLAM